MAKGRVTKVDGLLGQPADNIGNQGDSLVETGQIDLTPVEFKILGVLSKELSRVFSRAEIIESAFGYDFEGFDRTIDVHILNIRRKIEIDPSHPRYIKTVYGAGYKLVEG